MLKFLIVTIFMTACVVGFALGALAATGSRVDDPAAALAVP